MERLVQDLRFALRLFRKDRAFALTTILTLALCIGANTAIFTIVRSVLLRPLPYPESDRLVFLYDAFPGAGVERAGTSVPNYYDRLALTDLFDSQALYQSRGFRVGQGAAAEGVPAMHVTPSLFNVLKVPAARGRWFAEDEGTPGRNRVTVLSWAFAARQPGGVDGIVGRDLVLDNDRYTVVGVMPETFSFLNPDVRLWVPLAFTAEERGGGSPPQPEPRSDRPAGSRRDADASASADRRDERGDCRAFGRDEGDPHQRRLPHGDRFAGGGSRARRAFGTRDALGRRGLPAPHRGGEHHQSLARAGHRPPEGGRDASRARRGAGAASSASW